MYDVDEHPKLPQESQDDLQIILGKEILGR